MFHCWLVVVNQSDVPGGPLEESIRNRMPKVGGQRGCGVLLVVRVAWRMAHQAAGQSAYTG